MKTRSNTTVIDPTKGSILRGVIAFAIPVMLTSMLQMLLTTIDSFVIGRFCGSDALAAMGCATPIVSLLVNILLGISTGAAVCTAQALGSKNEREVHETVHTAMLVSLISGALFCVIGILLSRYALIWTDCPDEVFAGAHTYLWIYLLGIPFSMFFNFGAAILRASGDTKTPLYYMTTSGIINVCLNLFFVIVLHWNIAGVAIATIISQFISSILVLKRLSSADGAIKLEIKKMKIYKQRLLRILRIGVPSAIQTSCFCFSNIVIQSSINSLGTAVVVGTTAAGNYEAFIAVAMNAFAQTAITFVAQNLGAKQPKRITKAVLVCCLCGTTVSIVLNALQLIFREPLLSVFIVDNEEAIRQGIIKMFATCPLHFVCGILDVFMGANQGLGVSVSPTIIQLAGTCGLRLVWVATVFKHAVENRAFTLFIIYPITWTVTLFATMTLFFYMKKKIVKQTLGD